MHKGCQSSLSICQDYYIGTFLEIMIASFNFFLCYDTSHPIKPSDLPITSTTTKNKNDEFHDHERPNTNNIMTSIPIAVKETAETQFTNQEQHVEPILFPEISREEDEDDDDAESSEEMRNSLTCSQLMSLHALSSVADLSNDPADTSIPNAQPVQDDSHPQTTPSQAKDELIRRLHRIFELEEREELISSHPCWLFRNIVLQGYLYVLTNNLCFYANLPSRQDKLIRSGALRKKTRKSRRFSSHWAILRGRTLSWYESEYDPYFPQDKIDLRDVLEVNALPITSNPQFEVVTPYRTFLFEATDAEEWVNALKKATFRAQNEGENVRITIPYEAILDIDSSNANPAAGHTSRAEHGKGIQDVAVVTIKVIQSQPGETEMTMDEYFFTNMADEAHFVTFLREKLATINAVSSQTSSGSQVRASIGAAKTIASGLRRTETLRQGNRTPTLSIHRSGVDNALESQLADATNDTSISTPPSASTILSTSVTTLKAYSLESAATGYPPSPHIDPASIDPHLAGGDKRWAIPQWLLDASGKLAQNTSGGLHAITNRLPTRLVREQWSAQPLHDSVIEAEENHTKVSLDASHDDDLVSSIHSTFSILEDSEAAAADVQKEEDMKEQESLEQFRSCFSLPDEEELLHHTSTNLYRILPVSGRLFVSTNYVCFRSSRLATKTIGRTMMILPRKEIISVAKNNAVQYGRHGLVIIVRGHEELFFEFVSTHRRDQCISIIELQPVEHTQDDDDEEGVPSLSLTDLGFDVQSGSDSSQNLSVPSLFASSSSFVPTKPKENMHFTFLTVGSRGDVQPYIALARGLQKEGHRVRIATHAEFGKWIESFSIEFCEIGGDPAELMKICIENGTFTLAFVRESVTKFRGWLDDLLLSCWHACQGTDVIIESPSAIAGIHIAEALRIPYYRAFTMPWTRTRSYPHAFAVPSRRAGGNYNYMSYVIFDQVFWRASAGQINAWRKKCLRLTPTNMDKLEQHKIPFLYNFSPSLVPKPLDWSDWIHVCGFWFLDNADETGSSQIWQAPKELIDFIAKAKEDQKKIVYIGWGSIVIADADAVLQTVIEAVRKSDVCAIISRGWSDRLQESKDPATKVEEAGDDVWRNIFTIQSVPHDWLFPQMDAACHHGGSGTLGASLRAGIPTIVRPFFGDQFFWASQVESLQIGVSVANKPFTVDTFANALRLCTTDVRMKRNARTLADSIAKEKGVANAIRAIYADWDYACSRVKPNLSTATTLLEPGLPIKTKISRTEEEDEEAKSMDEWSVVSGSEEGIADVI